MLNYSLHTIELTARLKAKDALALEKHLYTYNESSTKKMSVRKEHRRINDILERTKIWQHIPFPGICKITCKSEYKTTDNGGYYLSNDLYIIINLYRVLHSGSDENIQLINSEEIVDAINTARHSLKILLSEEIENLLTLSRTDFCVNLPFETQTEAREYLTLLRRGIPIKALKEYKEFDQIQCAIVPYTDSLLLVCDRYDLQIYPKYDQMLKHALAGAELAKGILRIELRARRRKLEQLAEKYNIPSPQEDYIKFLVSAPLITKQEIPYILARMVGHHAFTSYKAVKDAIKAQHFCKKTATNMKSIISYYNSYRSPEYLLYFCDLSYQQWQHLLTKFDLIEYSPVVIPEYFEYSYYPGVSSWDTWFDAASPTSDSLRLPTEDIDSTLSL